MVKYKWKCMVLGALKCTNNSDLNKIVNENIVPRSDYYLPEITTRNPWITNIKLLSTLLYYLIFFQLLN